MDKETIKLGLLKILVVSLAQAWPKPWDEAVDYSRAPADYPEERVVQSPNINPGVVFQSPFEIPSLVHIYRFNSKLEEKIQEKKS